MTSKVKFGVDELLVNMPAELRRARVGMVTSNVATAAFNGETSRVALRRAGANLTRLFGPEHGLTATAADGDHVDDAVDPATLLPVVSLYGQHVRPTREMLDDVDLVLFDIPDVGARFYTYIWTLSHVMEACADAGKPVYVLDRPNPIGGDLAAVEGPILDEACCSSFVGRWNLPVRYALTIGELARLWNAERQIGCDLRVVRCAGWRRAMHWPETGVKFVAPSPNLPSYESAVLYPGTCLIEGTTLSEGRGTEAPFQLIGAPGVDGEALAAALSARQLPGVVAHAATFVPTSRKHAGERCGGVRLEVVDAKAVRPVAMGLYLVAELVRLLGNRFEWLPKAGEHQHFDRLIGRTDVRPALAAGVADLNPRVAEWTRADGWADRARPHLLYE
jgi:uncharacterized protein YbbC (DUF1343 family)